MEPSGPRTCAWRDYGIAEDQYIVCEPCEQAGLVDSDGDIVPGRSFLFSYESILPFPFSAACQAPRVVALGKWSMASRWRYCSGFCHLVPMQMSNVTDG